MTKARTATITKKQTSHSSLFARCTAPFISKQHNHFRQEIRLDEPFRQYYPGDSVKGSVRLDVVKPIRITHLSLRLHGFVKVINRSKLPGEEIQYDEKLFAAGTGKGRRGIEYFGNGFAQLFDEEIVLCGDGCLYGKYEFQFELDLPSKGLPSSINFEHGTISYLLSSTVTRPTAIAPKSTLHCKLNVQEIIDIASVPKPKPQTLSLEVSSRKKPKRDTKHASANMLHSPISISAQLEEDPPRSPVPSEISSASLTGSSTSSDHTGTRTPSGSIMNTANQESLDRDITASATTEILQGGCMAGETIAIRVIIQHVQNVKNMQGIVITLFRQGRIDTHPAIPLGPCRRGKKVEYEDYYPRSRTGLGGLSLSSAGSSRSFRQDLNQIFAPILVDPHTHTHVVNTSISVPVDLFPTISCVPGAMISFNYYVEIVVDLRTKVASQDRIRPHLSMTSTQQHSYNDSRISRHEGRDGVSYMATPGYNCLVTDQLRRTKGVIFTRTEVIIGTRDSARKRGKQREYRPLSSGTGPPKVTIQLGREQDPQDPEFDQEPQESIPEFQICERRTADSMGHRQILYIPQQDLESELDEKERLRRAEQRLLPSSPPETDMPSPSVPSVPLAADAEDFTRRYGLGPPAPAYERSRTNCSANINNDMASSLSMHLVPGPQDDKQELERQRLLPLTSAPPVEDEVDEAVSTQQGHPPSAPIIFEDDVFNILDPRVPQTPEDIDLGNVRSADEEVPTETPIATSSASEVNSRTNHDQHEAAPSHDQGPSKEDPPVYER